MDAGVGQVGVGTVRVRATGEEITDRLAVVAVGDVIRGQSVRDLPRGGGVDHVVESRAGRAIAAAAAREEREQQRGGDRRRNRAARGPVTRHVGIVRRCEARCADGARRREAAPVGCAVSISSGRSTDGLRRRGWCSAPSARSSSGSVRSRRSRRRGGRCARCRGLGRNRSRRCTPVGTRRWYRPGRSRRRRRRPACTRSQRLAGSRDRGRSCATRSRRRARRACGAVREGRSGSSCRRRRRRAARSSDRRRRSRTRRRRHRGWRGQRRRRQRRTRRGARRAGRRSGSRRGTWRCT